MTSIVEIKNVSKHFGGVKALTDVSLSLNKGEVHALMGENGAGKSTLSKILSGIHQHDEGTLIIDGKELSFSSPKEAFSFGIGMVHQELAFCPNLTVKENLSLGRYPTKRGIFLDDNKMSTIAEELLQKIGFSINVNEKMENLTTAQSQMVQIAFAYGAGAKVLIFDEPTSSLSEKESVVLFQLINELKQAGVAILYVSHRMKEVFDLSDKISILRDGRFIATYNKGDYNPNKLISAMIGREYEKHIRNNSLSKKELLLSVEGLGRNREFNNVNLSINSGEVLGVSGLVGSGRSELFSTIFGLNEATTGRIIFEGIDITKTNLKERINKGIIFLPEDRKREGLAQEQSIYDNFTFTLLDQFSKNGFLLTGKLKSLFGNLMMKLNLKYQAASAPVSSLSGGNQQKVVLAKWLALDSKIVILDEPTKGIDIGTKEEIYKLIESLAGIGKGVVVISSELPELLSVSDRIIVMRQGELVAEYKNENLEQDELLKAMSGF